jgi:hypothetical protein
MSTTLRPQPASRGNSLSMERVRGMFARWKVQIVGLKDRSDSKSIIEALLKKDEQCQNGVDLYDGGWKLDWITSSSD